MGAEMIERYIKGYTDGRMDALRDVVAAQEDGRRSDAEIQAAALGMTPAGKDEASE